MVKVFTAGIVRTNFKGYPTILKRVMTNLKQIGPNTNKKLSKIHLDRTKEIIQNSDVNSPGKKALLTGIEYKDNNKEVINILSVSEIGAFFEQGVKPHYVYPSMISVYGGKVSKWMEKHGVDAPFIVGGPNSVLSKSDPLHFMFTGYDEAWGNAINVVDNEIKKI